jgi:predicted metallo-beta-lactamase superfamily hydrolase
MCTFVETPDVTILLDAGVSVCPNRFGLPPHPCEFAAIAHCRETIAHAAEKADIVTISHYHFDHYTPSFEDWLCNWTEADASSARIYRGKLVLAKNPREAVNYSQRERGWIFGKTGGKAAKRLEFADGKAFVFGETRISFSSPVPHGLDGTPLGWVLMCTVDCGGDKFMCAPDVQGPMSSGTLKLIQAEKPQLLMLGGPPLYLTGFKVTEGQMKMALENLTKVIQSARVTILEHHLLRDQNWRSWAQAVIAGGGLAHQVLTAAEALGGTEQLLEARRKEMFEKHPPSNEFKKWMRLSGERKRLTRPPI